MKIKYTYVRSDDVIKYDFQDDIIVVEHISNELVFGKTLDEPTQLEEVGRYEDTFDFSDMPNGKLEILDSQTGELLVETTLPENPIESAERIDGELWVQLVVFFGGNEIDDVRNLDWFDTKEVEPDGEDDLEGQQPN